MRYAFRCGLKIRLERGTLIASSGTGDCGGQKLRAARRYLSAAGRVGLQDFVAGASGGDQIAGRARLWNPGAGQGLVQEGVPHPVVEAFDMEQANATGASAPATGSASACRARVVPRDVVPAAPARIALEVCSPHCRGRSFPACRAVRCRAEFPRHTVGRDNGGPRQRCRAPRRGTRARHHQPGSAAETAAQQAPSTCSQAGIGPCFDRDRGPRRWSFGMLRG